MQTAGDFSKEKINLLELCHITISAIPTALRNIFIQEWNNHYNMSPGQWLDTADNGLQFYNNEPLENQRKLDSSIMKVIKEGNSNEWDCNCLLFSILDSASIGSHLNHQVRSNVKIVRECQKILFSKEYEDGISDTAYKNIIQSLVDSFNDLGLTTEAIENMRNQRFSNLQLIDLETKLQDQRSSYEAFLNGVLEVKHISNVNADQPFFNFQSFLVLPPHPNHETIRRTNLEDKILDALEDLEKTNPNEVVVAYISGVPGSGKSQIAREIGQQFFAKKSKSSSKAVFVMTFNAENLDTLLESFLRFSNRLGCIEHFVSRLLQSEKMTVTEKLTCFKNLVIPQVRKFLSWLIILDNVIDVNSVSEFLPLSNSNEWGPGSILVTMQDSQLLPMIDSKSCHFCLSKGMEPDVAGDLLSSISTLSSDRDKQMQVAKVLEFQPLSLACAALFVRDMTNSEKQYAWKQYLEIIKERKMDAAQKAVKSKTGSVHPESITASIALLVERELKQHQAFEHIFQFLSLIAPDPLPIDLAAKLATLNNGALQGFDGEKLVTSSPLVSIFDFDCSEIQVHEIVLDVLRSEVFPVQNIENYVSNVTSLISLFSSILDIDNNNVRRHTRTETLRPHMAVLAQHVEICWSVGRDFAETQWSNRTFINSLKNIGSNCNSNAHITSNSANKVLEIALQLSENFRGNIGSEEIAQILSLLANGYRYVTKLKEAKDMLKRALELYQNVTDKAGAAMMAKTLNDLGKVHFELGEFEEARICYMDALDKQKHVLGSFHYDVAECLQNLGVTYYHLAKYEQSQKCHSQALHILRTLKHEIDDIQVADCLNDLGNSHNELAEYDLAVKHYKESLSIRKQLYGKKHSKVAQVLDNIGCVYKSLAMYEAAKKYHQEALEIRRQAQEINYPDVANSLDNLGTVHQAVADFHAAKVCFEQALAIRQTVYPDTHPAVAMSFSNLGVVEEDLADYEAAKTFHQRALEITEKAHGREHPSVGRSFYNQGAVYLALDDFCKAKECFTEALRIRKKVHGSNHPKVATCLEGLGIVYRELAKLEKAQSYLNEALLIKQKVFNHNHPSVATSLDHLGTVQQMAGKHEAAKKLYHEALDIRLNVCGESTPDVAVSFNNLGLISRALTKYQTAKEYLMKALSINQRVYGRAHPIVADCLGNLGVVYEDLGEHETAKTLQEESISIMQNVHGNNHDTVANSLHNLGNIHWKLADYGAAKNCHKQAMTIRTKIYGQNHPLIADSFFALGIVHHQLSEHDDAMECYKRALAMRQAMYGCNHESVAASFDNLGCLFQELKQGEAAIACHEQSLAIRQSLYGEEHPLIASSLYNLASDHMSLNDYDKAEKFHLAALEMKQKFYGCDHPSVANSFNNLGIIFMLRGEYTAAKHYHQIALSIRSESNKDDDSLEIAISLHNLGLVHQSLCEHEIAKHYLQQALDIRQKLQGDHHYVIGYTLDSLGLVYQELGEYDNAKQCHKKALEIRQKIHGQSDLTVADSLFKLGVVHLETSDYKEAKEYFHNVLTVSGNCQLDSQVVGLTHHNLGIVYENLDQADLSIKHLEQARSILKNSLGTKDPKVVQVTDELKKVQSLGKAPKKCVVM